MFECSVNDKRNVLDDEAIGTVFQREGKGKEEKKAIHFDLFQKGRDGNVEVFLSQHDILWLRIAEWIVEFDIYLDSFSWGIDFFVWCGCDVILSCNE